MWHLVSSDKANASRSRGEKWVNAEQMQEIQEKKECIHIPLSYLNIIRLNQMKSLIFNIFDLQKLQCYMVQFLMWSILSPQLSAKKKKKPVFKSLELIYIIYLKLGK